MPELDPLDLTTRKEKIVVVMAALVSVALHAAVIFLGSGGLTDEEKKDKKLMIVRRLPELKLPPPLRTSGGAPPSKQIFQRNEVVVDKKVTPPVEGEGQPPQVKGDNIPTRAAEETMEKMPPQEQKRDTIMIFTDLSEAFFRVEGPLSFKGAGTYWEKSGLPPGDYRVTFGAVEGYQTPAPQDGRLDKDGAVSFTGRYTKMTMVRVDVNVPAGRFKIVRPDGQYLDLGGSRQGLFKDLPPGTYTAVYENVPGYGTPRPQNQVLTPGGQLAFTGYYSPLMAGGPGGAGDGAGQKRGTSAGAGEGSGEGGLGAARGASGLGAGGRGSRGYEGPLLDRRIKLVVKSYPPTNIERDYGLVEYPEVGIRRKNFQEGWCQVYLILSVNGNGEIERILIERPRAEDRELFAPLIEAAERAVSQWDYDRQQAEVHVDVRFFVEK